ncbi:MAG TPA: DsbA family protein [Candidatus Omnitrophota bacterium]|nr:DsbA family protein [Candidatus Omnitrophota bacterium]
MKAFARLLVLGLMAVPAVAGAAESYQPHPLDQVMGKPDAKVTIVEYASTTCPHCATLHNEVMPRIKKEWVDTGKAKLVYRDFPTGPAALSIGASMIAHCAGPERYYGVLGLIMQAQDKWLRSQNPLDELKRTVRMAGITGEQVDACLQRKDLQQAIVERAAQAGKAHTIKSTPTVFINGEMIVGAESYDVYDRALKAASK